MKIKPLILDGKEVMTFICPGCGDLHWFDERWQFNGDRNKPTIHPSLKTDGPPRCHSFIKDGMIRFLGDCEHDLRGQTVEIPDNE